MPTTKNSRSWPGSEESCFTGETLVKKYRVVDLKNDFCKNYGARHINAKVQTHPDSSMWVSNGA
jgi:hypothetical protein